MKAANTNLEISLAVLEAAKAPNDLDKKPTVASSTRKDTGNELFENRTMLDTSQRGKKKFDSLVTAGGGVIDLESAAHLRA